MEYPANKKNPVLLLKLVHLYLEYAAFRGALSVCTLLVEGYASFTQANESIFLSAVTAKALGKHQESAQYFNYLVDKPPHRLSAYQLHLLAAREFERVSGMHDHAREAYAEAYRAMIALAPVTTSEKAAHEVYKSSRKNESARTQLWYQDDNVWFDLAKKMASINAPLLVLSALDVVRQRSGVFPIDMLILDGVSSYRSGNVEAAERSLSQAIQLDYHSKHLRFLLQHWSESWRQQFALEEQSATRIQQVSRSYSRRKRWRFVAHLLVDAHRSAASCTIQCAWRGFAAQRELCRLKEKRREREHAENAAMALQDEFVIRKHLNAQARKIQALHMIFLAKRERRIREDLRERHRTILRDFAVQRAVMGRTHVLKTWALFVQIQRRERSDAAAVIQRSARAYNTRKMVKRLLKRRQNQERVIEMCVGRKTVTTKRIVLAEWKAAARDTRRAKILAVTKIQSFYRSQSARRRYRIALRRHKLTLDLMSRMVLDRTHRLMTKSWTALSSNAVWHRLQKRKSAIAIQKRVRGMRGRRIAKALRSRRRRVETAIRAIRTRSVAEMLRLVFRSLQQNIETNFEERNMCATSIQRVYRGFRARKRVRIMRECHRMLNSPDLTLKNRSRDFVLRLCFLILARYPEQEASERLRSAARIQRSWRHRRQMRRLSTALVKIKKRRAILVHLNASFKALATIFFAETKKLVQARRWRENRAARRIQHAMRMWFTRRRYARVVEKKAHAHMHAQQLERQKRNDWLASVLREWRKALVDEKLEVHRAATRIQRAYRARVAQQQASKVIAKKAAQARLLASVSQKPLERCFQRWEAVLMEKCVLSVRSAQKSSMVLHGDDKRRLASEMESRFASNNRDARTLDQVLQNACARCLNLVVGCAHVALLFSRVELSQRAEVPSLLFYTMLNRVRKTGICQLSYRYTTLRPCTNPFMHAGSRWSGLLRSDEANSRCAYCMCDTAPDRPRSAPCSSGNCLSSRPACCAMAAEAAVRVTSSSRSSTACTTAPVRVLSRS